MGVAWGCAAWVDPILGSKANGYVHIRDGGASIKRLSRPGLTVVLADRWRGEIPWPTEARGLGLDVLRPEWGSLDRPTREFQAAQIPAGVMLSEFRALVGCGWPTLALWCEPRRTIVDSPQWPPTQIATRGFIELSRGFRTDEAVPRVLPLIPIWPGFAINTVFYAIVLWLLIPGPFALRRLIRRRRGLCFA